MDKLDEHAEISPIVVWINGVCGIGKTSVCEKLGERLKCGHIIKSDETPEDFSWEMIFKGGGTGNPQTTTTMADWVREIIERAVDSPCYRYVIVDMAITTTLSKERVYDYIRDKGINDIHFILTATQEAVNERIANDVDREKVHAYANYHEYSAYLKSHFDEAIRIDTTDMDVDEVVSMIYNEISNQQGGMNA